MKLCFLILATFVIASYANPTVNQTRLQDIDTLENENIKYMEDAEENPRQNTLFDEISNDSLRIKRRCGKKNMKISKM